MSMQISVDPAALSQEQREAVAGFILAYPGKACAGTCGGHAVAEIHAHTHQAPVASGDTGPALDPEIAALVKDDGEFQASVAFGAPAGDPVAAAVFGVPPAPLPLGATAAPSIAVAAPLSTAPAVMPATTFPGTLSVPAPPAPMPANAAAIAAPQTGNPAPGVELDKHGLPWDDRIHAGTKRKNADGSWTAKRGVDPTLVATVEAELRQVMGAAPAAPLAPAAPVPPPTAPSAPVVASVPQATATPAPAAVPAPPAVPAGEVPADARAQFVALVGRASAAIQGQKVTQAEVNQCCADAGVPALPLLANRLDLVAQVAAHIDALIAARQ